jgi:CO dehydrogenase maturation factor
MKIAITGKGGVGKTTLSAMLSCIYSSEGKKVIAVDADPDSNLASAFGISREIAAKIKPIAELTALIEQRTGARPGTSGGIFKLNPKVDDIPEEYGYKINNITLLITGRSKEAASGCYCPENAFLRRLLKYLIADRNEVVIVDMEAGIEHLTRGTAESVDAFIVVVEPGQRSIQTAQTVKNMAEELGVKKVFVVANKVKDEEDLRLIKHWVGEMKFLGEISFSDFLIKSDMKGEACYGASTEAFEQVKKIKENLSSFLKEN